MSNKIVNERKLIYTPMAHGTLGIISNGALYNLEEYLEDYHDNFKIEDEISIAIRPDVGYMIGIISITEDSTGDDVEYNYTNNPLVNNIVFTMPNDDVNISVKFVKIPVI